MRSGVLALLPTLVSGHAAMVSPRPRNAVDADIAPWNLSVPDFLPVSGELSCVHSARSAFQPWFLWDDGSHLGARAA